MIHREPVPNLIPVKASVCGRRAGKVERKAERSTSRIGAEVKRPAAEPQTEAAADAVLDIQARDERAVCEVERAWSRGIRVTYKPAKRSNPRVGHGGAGDLRGAPARNTRSENPRPFSYGSTRASISKTG